MLLVKFIHRDSLGTFFKILNLVEVGQNWFVINKKESLIMPGAKAIIAACFLLHSHSPFFLFQISEPNKFLRVIWKGFKFGQHIFCCYYLHWLGLNISANWLTVKQVCGGGLCLGFFIFMQGCCLLWKEQNQFVCPYLREAKNENLKKLALHCWFIPVTF